MLGYVGVIDLAQRRRLGAGLEALCRGIARVKLERRLSAKSRLPRRNSTTDGFDRPSHWPNCGGLGEDVPKRTERLGSVAMTASRGSTRGLVAIITSPGLGEVARHTCSSTVVSEAMREAMDFCHSQLGHLNSAELRIEIADVNE